MYVNRDAPNQLDDFEVDLLPETRAAARRTVCAQAMDANDAADLMMMLGLHPTQEDNWGNPQPPQGSCYEPG